MSVTTRRARRLARWIAARFGPRLTLARPACLTVLIAVFHPSRLVDLDTTVRSLLRCTFVESIVIAVNNPALRMDQWLRVSDPRVLVEDAGRSRGCGARWRVAAGLEFEYLLVLDDDLLLTPAQVARLFAALMDEPGVPHGVAGLQVAPGHGHELVDRREGTVDFLCEAYALTAAHVRRYIEYEQRLAERPGVRTALESRADFALVSRVGTGSPRIHDVGHLLRSETFKQPGIAVHKEANFGPQLEVVSRALTEINLLGGTSGAETAGPVSRTDA